MYIYFCYVYIIKFEQMSSKEDIEKIQSAEKKAIEEDKDPIVSEKNEKLGQLRDFKLLLLRENLRLLQQFRKFLIQNRYQVILLPLQNLDLIIGEDDQYLKIKFKKLYEDFLKSRRMLIDYGEKRRDVKIKQQKILKEILKEKQKCQIYHFYKKQVKQIDQHVDSITNLIVPIKLFSEQQFQLTIKIAARLLDNYQRTQEPSIKKISEEQILKPNNEAIQETNKRLLPIRIEQHSGVDNFNQIKHLKQSIKVKRQKFNHNYHSNEESQKITIEQLVEQFDKIEEELTQNEQEIENIISNIKKVKDSMVSEKNEKLVPPSTFNKDSENEHFE